MQIKQPMCQISATVTDIQPLNDSVVELAMTHEDNLNYRAGQSVTLVSSAGLVSRYSIANSLSEDKIIKIHITHSKKNPFSQWVHDQLTLGETILIDQPEGQCFYQSDHPDQALMLIGTDCGLAPLTGILRDAFKHNHTGPIYLIHSAQTVASFYWVADMAELMQEHANFWYFPCLSSDRLPPGYRAGQACDVAVKILSELDLQEWYVFLYGSSPQAGQATDAVMKAGIIQKEIKTRVFSARRERQPVTQPTNPRLMPYTEPLYQ